MADDSRKLGQMGMMTERQGGTVRPVVEIVVCNGELMPVSGTCTIQSKRAGRKWLDILQQLLKR